MHKPQTPEDFQRAFKALNDANASPVQFSVKSSLGYCSKCDGITGYFFDRESGGVQCEECGTEFSSVGTGASLPLMARHSYNIYHHYVTRHQMKLVPEEVREKLEYLLSREGQRKILNQMLRQQITETHRRRMDLQTQLAEAENDLMSFMQVKRRYQ